MKDERIYSFIKSLIWGLGWFVVASLIGFIIIKVMPFKSFKDILFIEGLVLIFAGVFASISGNPMGLSVQGLGQNNAQYIANANLEISKREKEKFNVKTNIAFALSTFSLVIGGVLSIILTFIM